jgi:hypothetical protein
MDIKSLKPRKNGRFQQGYINPNNCKKLFESVKNQPIIYRSSWERRFISWCENCKKVKYWGSECICIKYHNPVDQKQHRYYPDFVVQLEDGTVMIVEIKPKNQTQIPDCENSWATKTYAVNSAKWSEIKKRCDEKGYKFCILTEKTIAKL